MNVEEYKLIRNSIQLNDVNIGELHVEGDILTLKNTRGKLRQKFNLSQNLKIIEDTPFSIEGKCKILIEINHPSFINSYKICLVVIGLFNLETKEDISYDEIALNSFKENVSKLCIPLLLPYVKSYMQIVTGMLAIPPVPIPTMDIIRSIEENSK